MASVNARPFLLPVYQGSKFSLSPLDWEGEKNSLSANDFTSFLNGWKVIPYELLQNKHSYFIVLTALSLIVPIKERCQCYFFFCLCPRATHQCFLGWCKSCVGHISVKWAGMEENAIEANSRINTLIFIDLKWQFTVLVVLKKAHYYYWTMFVHIWLQNYKL